MKIVIMPKVGFCYGVERSITMTKELINGNYQKPFNLLGMLVHNNIVNDELKSLGFNIIDINNLADVLNNTNGTFITTAHGIKKENSQMIKDMGFTLIDTTCPIVLNNNNKIYKYYQNNYDIIYIGKRNHQESNVIKEYVHLIENENDIHNLNISNNLIVLTNQTTVSIVQIEYFSKLIQEKYPNIIIDTCICPATKERQQKVLEEVKLHHSQLDKWIIIGDKLSNNTKKLVEIIKEYTDKYYFINCIEDVDNLDILENDTLYITSGTSTPNTFIDEVIEKIKKK